MSYEVHVIDRWDLRQKDVYVISRDQFGGTYLLQDGEMVHYPPATSFEGNPTFVINQEWQEQLLEALLGTRPADRRLEDILAKQLEKEEERVDKMLDKMLE